MKKDCIQTIDFGMLNQTRVAFGRSAVVTLDCDVIMTSLYMQ